MQYAFFPSLVLQLLYQVLYRLHLRALGYQHSIRRFHNNDIFYSGNGDKTRLRLDIAILHICSEYITRQRIALPVLSLHFPYRIPGPEVIPARIQRNNHGGICLLHYRIVNRITAATGKNGLGDMPKILTLLQLAIGLMTAFENIRSMSFQLIEVGRSREQKHATIPIIVAAIQIRLRRLAIRFLHELLN